MSSSIPPRPESGALELKYTAYFQSRWSLIVLSGSGRVRYRWHNRAMSATYSHDKHYIQARNARRLIRTGFAQWVKVSFNESSYCGGVAMRYGGTKLRYRLQP